VGSAIIPEVGPAVIKSMGMLFNGGLDAKGSP